MAKAPDAIFVQNVGILSQHMAAVARDVAAGNTAQAAESLKAISDAARWLSEWRIGPKPPIPPPQMLPGQGCRPKMIDPFKPGQ